MIQYTGQCQVSTSLLQAALDKTGLVQAQYEYADKITGLAQARINLQSFQGIQQTIQNFYKGMNQHN